MEKIKLPETISPTRLMGRVYDEIVKLPTLDCEKDGCGVFDISLTLDNFEKGYVSYCFSVSMFGDKTREAARFIEDEAKPNVGVKNTFSQHLHFDIEMSGWPTDKEIKRKADKAVRRCVKFYRKHVLKSMSGEANAAMDIAKERIKNERCFDELFKGQKEDASLATDDGRGQSSDRVTHEEIDALMAGAEFSTSKLHGNTTVVTAQFANGWTMTEQSACIDPANYDHELGTKLCKERIENELWKLEGYRKVCEKGREDGGR